MRNKKYLCKSSTKEVYSHTCANIHVTGVVPWLEERHLSTGLCCSLIYWAETRWLSGESAGLAIRRPQVQVPLWPLAGFVCGSLEFKPSAMLVNSQLVCLWPVGFLTLLSSFWIICFRHLQAFVSGIIIDQFTHLVVVGLRLDTVLPWDALQNIIIKIQLHFGL